VYETSDGKHISVGPIEPQFFAEICRRLDVQPALWSARQDRSRWPELRAEFERLFKSQTQQAWTELLAGTDACFAPVLPLSEAFTHPHNIARQAFVELDGVRQPAPAPRVSRTPSAIQGAPPSEAVSAQEVASTWN
jgi:alpha-methylacyl-CoA racemase